MIRKIEIDEDLNGRLEAFKKIYDQIMEEDHDFREYVTVVMMVGLDKMRRDVIPEGQEWTTIEIAFNMDFEFMCGLISDIWRSGKEITEEQKNEVKDTIARYIS